MQIHKYKAKSVSAAIAMVKNELGPDAMILSSKKLNDKGSGHLFEIAAVASYANTLDQNSDSFDGFRSELMSIKEMIYILSHSEGMMEKTMLKPETLTLYSKMLRNGINDHYARAFLEQGGALNDYSPECFKTVREETIRKIMEKVEIHKFFETINKGRIITALVGTTGVGKTTTIAKIAARLSLKYKKKTGLISIDSYRIGAMEQLKTYANILGIPFFPAFNRKDLVAALERLKNMDAVLIDTAGQSQYDGKRIEELKNMMTDDLNIQSHLLLSVSTTEEEMNKTAEKFSPLKFWSYIFTKLDEAEKCGSIINQLMKKQLPISYLTTGQNVPEDIEEATKSSIYKLLFSNN
ncbi:MAG: hypothetical protein EHM85_07195 [Desulfobacteraceae bacterium]|nr:MAG: hypothetical protein EHM85_07195 [Desulfobacteraceae bacterium]